MPVWRRAEEPVGLSGLDEYPKVDDHYEIHGELWRAVEVSDRFVLEREPSKLAVDTAAESFAGRRWCEC